MLVTSITGAGLGLAGLIQSIRRDTTAARSTAQDVATRAAEGAVAALNAALDRLQGEHDDLTERVELMADDLARCEAVKLELTRRVRELEGKPT